MSFEDFGLHPALRDGIAHAGYTRPTPIQQRAIPAALAGRDLLASAQTGSGKTAAFLLPIVHRLMSTPGRARGVRALVVTPTRELAAQIVEHFEMLARGTTLRAAAVYGGVGMQPQADALRSGVDLVVATPGRLLDHLNNRHAKLGAVEVLVLDEADRMLDMGFLPDVKRILARVPAARQTLFFSATMPEPIVALTRELLKDPVPIAIGLTTAPAAGVRHAAFSVEQTQKGALCVTVVEKHGITRGLVFTRTRHRADRLAKLLGRAGIRVALIHGGRTQSQRTAALAGFREGHYRLLVATDIAARGIDVSDVSHVVNFDVPGQVEDYIHRVGRTARADATGDAFTFVSPAEEDDMRAIEKAIGRAIPRTAIGRRAEAQAPPAPGQGRGKVVWAPRRKRPRGRGGRSVAR